MCDHTIGILHDPVTKSEIKDLLHSEANGWNRHANRMNSLRLCSKPLRSDYKPADFLDRRRCLMTMFNYCPYCSAKINWKKIRKSL